MIIFVADTFSVKPNIVTDAIPTFKSVTQKIHRSPVADVYVDPVRRGDDLAGDMPLAQKATYL